MLKSYAETWNFLICFYHRLTHGTHQVWFYSLSNQVHFIYSVNKFSSFLLINGIQYLRILKIMSNCNHLACFIYLFISPVVNVWVVCASSSASTGAWFHVFVKMVSIIMTQRINLCPPPRTGVWSFKTVLYKPIAF